MGAALHLAHARQLPPAPKRKRGGGGGSSGDGYDQAVARIWHDKRTTPESRELLLLVTWLYMRDPNRYDENGDWVNSWARADKILGMTGYAGNQRQRIAELVYGDRPRYEPERGPEGCQAPMIRRDGVCGAPGRDTTFVVDSQTGWRTTTWYCGRHEEWGRKLDAVWRAGTWPEPIPNRGGLMPSYLRLKTGEEGWIRIYAEAARCLRRAWEPPVGFSVAADDWPTPGMERAPELAKLRLAAVDGELLASS